MSEQQNHQLKPYGSPALCWRCRTYNKGYIVDPPFAEEGKGKFSFMCLKCVAELTNSGAMYVGPVMLSHAPVPAGYVEVHTVALDNPSYPETCRVTKGCKRRSAVSIDGIVSCFPCFAERVVKGELTITGPLPTADGQPVTNVNDLAYEVAWE